MTAASLSYPLAMARTGEQVRIIGLAGGRSVDQRLTDRGLAIGGTVRVVQNPMTAPMIVTVHESRVSLGMCTAQDMTVESVEK